MERPTDIRYTTTHEWVKIKNGNTAFIGITDYPLKKVKDVVMIEFPEIEENLHKDESCCEIEYVTGVFDMLSPINGEVIDINEELESNFDILKKDPFGRGWILKLRVEDPGQVDDLLSLKSYQKLLAGEK
ncbi:glycine cleavage system protein GcvH [Planctomycetota bacterium]